MSRLVMRMRWIGLLIGLMSFIVGSASIYGNHALAGQATPSASPVASPVGQGGGVAAAAAWLLGQQAEDGGFVGFEGVSDPSVTADAIFALVAARDAGAPADVDAALQRAVAFLEQQSAGYAVTGAGQAAKIALAVAAVGEDPTAFGGVDLIALVEQGLDDETGIYGGGVYDHALAMLALAAAGRPIAETAITALEETRSSVGGWAFDGNPEPAAADSNTTAVVIQALVAAAPAETELIVGGLEFLRTAQADNGAFRFQPSEGFSADANSTGLVVQALIAAGEDPASESWRNAAAALAAFQNPSGAFRYADDQPDDNIFATVQAVPAVAGRAMPILPAGQVPGTPVATPAALTNVRFAA
ncbi:MAG: cell wall anchor protein [Chloroflexota bacterium]|nr:cell wall anchor protein [Chloroflexota bacterium]